MKCMYKGILFPALVALFFSYSLRAKERKAAPTSPQLYNEIAREDSLMFAAYNAQDINKLKTFFSKELEWFQDNEGLINYDMVFMNFENIFRRNTGLTRRLVKNSLEVHRLSTMVQLKRASTSSAILKMERQLRVHLNF